MSDNQPVVPVRRKVGFLEALLKGALGGLWLGAFLFIAAGRLDWPMAWIYTGISTVDAILLLLVVSPDLMRERTHPKADAKAWDRVFARLTGPLGSTVILSLPGWTSVSDGRRRSRPRSSSSGWLPSCSEWD